MKPTMLTLARLVPIKGLVPALQALRDRDDLEWVIAGDGPERAQLQRLAQDARLSVRLVGAVSGEEKRRWLAAADGLLLPSLQLASGRSEGMPTALLEAMAAGLPIVASRVGGVGELLQHGHTGLLFEPDAPGSLHANLDRLLRDPAGSRRMAAQAKSLAQEHRWSVIAPRLEFWLTRSA